MNYEEAREYLAHVAAAGNRLGLDSVRELMHELGDPQDACKVVHIAGTNGKGSVMTFLDCVLREAGIRTGRYHSPAIFEWEEEFQVGGVPIAREKAAELISRIALAREAIARRGGPESTVFEIETALAFLWFAGERCDLVLLECGMGGAEDATNITQSTVLELFSAISRDHMQYLGDTTAEIARVKAGILKEGTIAVTDRQDDAALEVLREEAAAKHVDLRVLDPEAITVVQEGLEQQTFVYRSGTPSAPQDCTDRRPESQPAGSEDAVGCGPQDGADRRPEPRSAALESESCCSSQNRTDHAPAPQSSVSGADAPYEIHLPGLFQIRNASLALMAVEALRDLGYDIPEAAVRRGLCAARWDGRFTVIGHEPLTVMDGAHNEGAARRLRESVDAYFGGRKIHAIFGVFSDKEYDKIIGIMMPRMERVYTVMTPDNPRALDAGELAKAVAKVNPHVTAVGDIRQALTLARESAGPDDVVLAFGSLSWLKYLRLYAGEAGLR